MSATNRRLSPDPSAWRTLLTVPVAVDVLAVADEFYERHPGDSRPLLLRAAEVVELAYEMAASPDPQRRTMTRRIVGITVRAGLEDAILCVEPVL